MPISDKFSTTTLFSTSRTSDSVLSEPVLPEALPERQTLRSPEQLTLELDFARVSHQSNITCQSHPHVLFSPIHYEPSYAYPLLVWLHGSGNDERQVMRIMPGISMRNYVAVAPRGLTVSASGEANPPTTKFDVYSILRTHPKENYDWINTDEKLAEIEQRVFDCIAVAKERCNIASDRVFLAGFGSGGTMALRLALLYPENFAGAASLDGMFPQNDRLLHRWETARFLSVFLAVGESGSKISPESVCQVLELLHTAGITVKFREYAQSLTSAMLQDFNHWMMDIVCG
ncbi:MAG: dienelactone hydrolase family protein [Planctomycetaceae bacterium]|jgi:phospholipase/carboxylesterase|nr:dienelactone hydrolase family protein [Planctomycetaceae bacterium]